MVLNLSWNFSGKYEVIFDDGVRWTCATARLSKLKEPTKKEALTVDTNLPSTSSTPSPVDGLGPGTSAPSTAPPFFHTHLFDPTRDYLSSKSERREMKRKLNVKELFNIGQKKKKTETPKSRTPSTLKKTQNKSNQLPRASNMTPSTSSKTLSTTNTSSTTTKTPSTSNKTNTSNKTPSTTNKTPKAAKSSEKKPKVNLEVKQEIPGKQLCDIFTLNQSYAGHNRVPFVLRLGNRIKVLFLVMQYPQP